MRELKVYFGQDLLPYKDKEHQVHFPIVGNAFQGASQTDIIKFYIGDIALNDSAVWVACAKLPTGELGYNLLDTRGNDDDGSYVQLTLTRWHTQYQGNLYICLHCYAGGIELEEDEETHLLTPVGEPVIRVTGGIKMNIAYATGVIGGDDIPTHTLEELWAEFGEYLRLEDNHYLKVIDVITNINNETNESYLLNGDLVLAKPTIADTNYSLYKISGTYPNFTYSMLGIQISALTVNTITTNQLNVPTFSDIKRGDNKDLATYIDEEIEEKVQEFAQNELQVVNELPEEGEEGIIYLLPIDPTDLTKGYYRYIWEEVSGTYQWLSLGTTEIDLSDYYTKSETNTLLDAKANASDVYTQSQINSLLSAKQDTLVSGTNIKTINNTSILGSGNYTFDSALNDSSTNAVQNKVLKGYIDDLSNRLTILEESIIADETLAYTYLIQSAIPTNVSSYPIIESAGMDNTNIKGNSFVYNQLVDTNTTEVATITGHKYLTRINATNTLVTATSGQTFSVTGGVDCVYDLTQSGLDSVTTVSEATTELAKRGINVYEYNPYNVGKIINSKPTALVSHGFNLWDEKWELGSIDTSNGSNENSSQRIRSKNYIKVIGNTQYYFRRGDNSVQFIVFEYDKNNTYLGYTSLSSSYHILQTKSNCEYIRFRYQKSSYTNDICINLSNASLNGTYKPYKTPITYPLSLPVLRSAGSVQNDTKKVRIGVVDLGTLNWEKQGDTGKFRCDLTNGRVYSSGQAVNILCQKYRTVASSYIGDLSTDKSINMGVSNKKLQLFDSAYASYDAASFKTAMNGVMLNYELATPTDQPSITLPENIEFEKGGSLEVEYDNTDKTPSDFDFEVAVYKPLE